ncbi:uncharacterized protein [Lepeophtheirus salmonis]|uniref:uncharacterized protein n=1 Tax=Lepeophtheirus salmonis TaxID=72036 RepID=UPI001AE807F8|nr:uncharacterized protein LOC121115191 [Lepeophtheirus salmonis]
MRVAKFVLTIIIAIQIKDCYGSELAILNFIPRELKQWLDPNEYEDHEHRGWVERGRRDLSDFEDDRVTYTVYGEGSGNPCIFAQTDCTFSIEYRTQRRGVQMKIVEMPVSPNITGSCIMTGDSSMISMLWSVYNFSLIFTKNPEGNSYYLNRASLVFTQDEDIFPYSDYNGKVILETKSGKNYYFTPLGKSYYCQKGRDQGPLKMYNTDDEVMGNITLYNSRFQPFVKRAKGVWGEKVECLSREIQTLREDIVPYAVSMIYIMMSTCLIAAYGIYRYFFVKKQKYECYGMEPEEEEGGKYGGPNIAPEKHEMKIKGANRLVEEYDGAQKFQGIEEPQETEALTSFQEAQPSEPKESNPFKATKSSNPFN